MVAPPRTTDPGRLGLIISLNGGICMTVSNRGPARIHDNSVRSPGGCGPILPSSLIVLANAILRFQTNPLARG